MDTDKLREIQQSERLRDFYKKLVQTDAAIRSLRKSLNEKPLSSNDFDIKSNNFDLDNNFGIGNFGIDNQIDFNIPDRSKRSIKVHPRRWLSFKRRDPGTEAVNNNGTFKTKNTVNMTAKIKPGAKHAQRNKRFGNFDDEGIFIEKNKIIIQFRPNRKVVKSTQSPKVLNGHSTKITTQFNHPYYKNSQRLDKLLKEFMDRKISDHEELNEEHKRKYPENAEIILVGDNLFRHYDDQSKKSKVETVNNKKHNIFSKSDISTVTKKVSTNKFGQESTKSEAKEAANKDTRNVYNNNFFDNSDGVDKSKKRTTPRYDILLSISTLDSPTDNKPLTSLQFPERPNMRKLQQVKTNNENSYEDIEDLNNSKEAHYGYENDDKAGIKQKVTSSKNYITDLYYNNERDSLPQYPEELTQMTKQEIPDSYESSKVDGSKVAKTDKNLDPTLSKFYKDVPVHNRDVQAENDFSMNGQGDVEYVEDYLDSRYEKLVELAQAYRNYDLLTEKKDTDTEKKTPEKKQRTSNENSINVTKKVKNCFKRGINKEQIMEKIKRGGGLSEGIRIELRPEKYEQFLPTAECCKSFKNMFQKHIKICNGVKSDDQTSTESSEIYTSDITHIQSPTQNSTINIKPMSDIVFKKRTLKAISNDFFTESNKNNDDDIENDGMDRYKLETKLNETKNVHKRDVNYTVEEIQHQNNSKISMVPIVPLADKKNINLVIQTSDSNITTPLNEHNISDGLKSSLSDFFTVLSNWFESLDKLESDKSTHSKITRDDQNEGLNNKQNDADIHKSRMLLSIYGTRTEKANEMSSTDNKKTNMYSSTESQNTYSISKKETTEKSTPTKSTSNFTYSHIVKRQAIDDSNLLFWNDLYDDEYGINADPVEKNVRDKHSAERNDFLKKSNRWIQDKVKMIANKLNFGDTEAKKEKRDRPKSLKRDAKYENDEENNVKLDIASLKERMKEVCKETIKAVQETKHVQVRDDNQKGEASSTLMQQLVRLMTDLVDFQVQERTCRKLPPDLQDFLEWLMSDKDDEVDSSYDTEKTQWFGNKLDETSELKMNEIENIDLRTDCLATMHAVQNLIKEYEDMSEDDKSLMTGVKTYLENQMNYLQKQLDKEYKQVNFSRFKRDIADAGHNVAQSIDAAAQSLDHKYKDIKKIYQKYKNKANSAYNQVLVPSAHIKEAISNTGKQISKLAAQLNNSTGVIGAYKTNAKFKVGMEKTEELKHRFNDEIKKYKHIIPYHKNLLKRKKYRFNHVGLPSKLNDIKIFGQKDIDDKINSKEDIHKHKGFEYTERTKNNAKDDYVDRSFSADGVKEERSIVKERK